MCRWRRACSATREVKGRWEKRREKKEREKKNSRDADGQLKEYQRDFEMWSC